MYYNLAHGLVVVVMDMQEPLLSRLPDTERTRLIQAHLNLAEACKDYDIPLIAVEFPGLGHTLQILQTRIDQVPRHRTAWNTMHKDSFCGTNLGSLFEEYHGKRALVGGSDASTRVLSTVESGFRMGFKMMTSQKLIADSDGLGMPNVTRWHHAHAILVEPRLIVAEK